MKIEDKKELIEFLKNNLRIEINQNIRRTDRHSSDGEHRLKVSLEIFDGSKWEEIDSGFGYIDKDDLDFVNDND